MREQNDYARRFGTDCLFSLLFMGVFLLQPMHLSTAQSCSFTISSSSQNFAYGGGVGSLGVTASSASCNWSAVSNASWVTITSGASGTGMGVVIYSVVLNPAPAMRTGTMTIAGLTFTVTQDAGQGGLRFYPLAHPVRLLDTRIGHIGCDAPGAMIPGQTSRTQTAAGRTCDGLTIPANAAVVSGNVTTVNPLAQGFLTLYPSDAARPLAANSNFLPNQTLNNVFTVGLGATNGDFDIYVHSTTDVVVDITGYYAPPAAGGLYFHPLPSPVRLLETRSGQQIGCFRPGTPLVANQEFTQLGNGTCGIPGTALALVGNATTVNPLAQGFLTLFPADAARPLAASGNYVAGQTLNSPFTVGLSPSGQFKIYTLRQTDLVIDVHGYYSADASDVNGAGLLFTPMIPSRLLDTRVGFIACSMPGMPIPSIMDTLQAARGVCTIPSTAQAIVGNATTVSPSANGFLTFWPSNATRPSVATSNFQAGKNFNRHFTVGLGTDGAFKIYALTSTHLVVDVSGYFAPEPVNQAPLANAGPDQTTGPPSNTASLTGSASDDGLPSNMLTVSWSKVSGPGTVNFSAPNSVATNAMFDQSGVYVLRLTASDTQLTATDDVMVTVNPPLAVNAGMDQVITLPNTAMMLGTVTGGSGIVALDWSKVSGPGSVLFSNASGLGTTAIFGVAGTYVLRLTAMDLMTTVSDDVQVIVDADPTPPPPDPIIVAPPFNNTVAATIGAATEFLYTGGNPIQTGVAPGMINPMRAAVLKGRVLDKTNNPLSLVKVTVLDHPEFGQTLSRMDGRFDLAVNGGGMLTVKYEKVGNLPAQRTENVPWQDFVVLSDVVMIGYDPNVTLIDLLANAPIQVAQSTVSIDSSGSRKSTLLFAQGMTATMTLQGGAMVGLDKLHIRATEFTVGANGPQTMPAELPPNSGYTYAVEYSLDEAVATDAIETTFSQPVISYEENFLGFPAGLSVPTGYYDRVSGRWLPSVSGRVVNILSISGGTANLDVDGTGQEATQPQYDALGITLAERQQLATLYTAGQSLWRTPLTHFSPWDKNWPWGPPIDAVPPNGDLPTGMDDGPAPDDPG